MDERRIGVGERSWSSGAEFGEGCDISDWPTMISSFSCRRRESANGGGAEDEWQNPPVPLQWSRWKMY